MSRKKPPKGTRLFWGADLSHLLILWLNSTKGTRRHERVASLLTLIREYFLSIGDRPIPTDVSEVGVLWWQGRQVVGDTRFNYPSRNGAANKAGDAVKAAVLKYAFSPELVFGFGGHLLFDWTPAKRDWRKAADYVSEGEDRFVFTETHAVAQIVELCREGLILRLSKCTCGLWYYAKFSHQKFHSTACQQKTYRNDPDWKAHRRKYMKRNRALHEKHVFRSSREPIRNQTKRRGE